MRCEDVQEELMSFILNELSDDQSKEVEDHIGSCEKCRSKVGKYRQTLRALSRWKVPPHNRPPFFAFLPEMATEGKAHRLQTFRFKKLAGYGIRLTFVAALAIAFLLGTHIKYERGDLSISIGNMPSQPTAMDSSEIAAVVDRAQRRNLQLVSEMIAASETRQAALYRSSLASFSRQMNDQQRSYIDYVMSHISRLQQQDQLAYYQSRAALDGVIKIANSVK